jgi:hypothetical protein
VGPNSNVVQDVHGSQEDQQLDLVVRMLKQEGRDCHEYHPAEQEHWVVQQVLSTLLLQPHVLVQIRDPAFDLWLFKSFSEMIDDIPTQERIAKHSNE